MESNKKFDKNKNAFILSETDEAFIQSLAIRYYSRMYLKAADEETKQRELSRCLLQATHLYLAASYFVHVSQFADDIAKVVNTTPKVICEWAEEPEWAEALKHFGWQENKRPQVDPHRESIPVPLREDFLLKRAFQKEYDVRFVTHEEIIDGRVKSVWKYEIVLEDGRTIPKLHVDFAFPKNRMQSVKEGIRINEALANSGLQPIKKISERPKVRVFAPIGSLVKCIFRSGFVVVGETIWVSKYNIVLRVGGKKGERGKVVLLYRHGLLEFRTLEKNEPPKTDDKPHDAEKSDAP